MGGLVWNGFGAATFVCSRVHARTRRTHPHRTAHALAYGHCAQLLLSTTPYNSPFALNHQFTQCWVANHTSLTASLTPLQQDVEMGTSNPVHGDSPEGGSGGGRKPAKRKTVAEAIKTGEKVNGGGGVWLPYGPL